jgi:hypothetical protein
MDAPQCSVNPTGGPPSERETYLEIAQRAKGHAAVRTLQPIAESTGTPRAVAGSEYSGPTAAKVAARGADNRKGHQGGNPVQHTDRETLRGRKGAGARPKADERPVSPGESPGSNPDGAWTLQGKRRKRPRTAEHPTVVTELRNTTIRPRTHTPPPYQCTHHRRSPHTHRGKTNTQAAQRTRATLHHPEKHTSSRGARRWQHTSIRRGRRCTKPHNGRKHDKPKYRRSTHHKVSDRTVRTRGPVTTAPGIPGVGRTIGRTAVLNRNSCP